MAYDLCSSTQCNVCLLFPNDNGRPKLDSIFFKCSGCQLVVYCGNEHQKLDWPLHRSICRVVQQILKVYNSVHPFVLESEPKCAKDLERSIALLKHLLQCTLRRRLNFYEEEITSFPPYCALCFRFKNIYGLTCVYCHSVSYCSPEHKKEHEPLHQRVCPLLQMYYCHHKVKQIDEENIPFNGFLVKVPKLQNVDLIDSIHYSTKVLMPKDPTVDLKSYQHFSYVADFSSIGTICYALEYVDMSSYSYKEFCIFVVGATVEEHLWFQTVHSRFFFLQYPKIESLTIYYIGPETKQKNGSQSQMYFFLGKKRIINHINYHGLFQDFIHGSMILPSIIVAFNCGFAENGKILQPKIMTDRLKVSNCNSKNTWFDGLREILSTYDVPFLFTSFTKSEADADYAELLKVADNIDHDLSIGINCILKSTQNPYRDLRPLRNWQITDDEDIYYRNGYIQLISSFVKK